MNISKVFLFFLLINFFSFNNAHAYLDPGSASIIFQFFALLLGSLIIFIGRINNLINSILSKKKISTLIILNLTLFPIWIFKSSLSISFIIYSLIYIYIIPLFFFLILFWNVNQYQNINNLNLFKILIISILTIYSIDQNIGLWTITSYFPFHGKNLYIFSVSFIFIIFFIFYYLIKKFNFKYLFVLLIFVFTYNLFSTDKSLNNLNTKISFDNYESEKLSLTSYKKSDNSTLFIILDEMNGIGGLDKDIINYEKAKSSFINLAENFQLTLYPFSYTTVPGTLNSIPRMLNFDNSYNKPYYNNYVQDHDEYFFWKKLVKNKLFNKYENNKIYVKQTLSIDFCRNKNIITCETHNPYSNKMMKKINYSNLYLTEIVSKFSYQNSIFSRILSRILVEMEIINLSVSPRSDKAYFEFALDNLFSIVKQRDYDLYFAHFLVPHKPFGYNKKCKYETFGVLNTNSDFMKTQHNTEIYCTNLFLGNFLKKLEKLKKYEKLNIIIVSDHGARNTKEPKDEFSVVSIIKKNNMNKYHLNNEVISVQTLVSNFFKQDKLTKNKIHKYYNYNSKNFNEVNF